MLKLAALALALTACATTSRPLPLRPGDGCVAALDTTWWGGSFEAAPGQVHGAGLELRTEGDVLVGFVGGRQTRLRVSEGRLSGSYAGQPADFKIAREDGRLVLRGTLGSLGQVVMRSHPNQIDFYSEGISVELARAEGGAYTGTSKRFADISEPRMQVRGCDAMFGEPVFLLAVLAPFVTD